MSGYADTIREDFPNATPRPWYFDGWDIFTSADSAGPRGDGHRLVVPLSHLNETFHPSQRVSEDDARLIVAAVNERDALVAKVVEQADRIAWLEGEVAGWRIKNQHLRDALGEIVALYDRPETGRRKTAAMVARAALDGTPSEDRAESAQTTPEGGASEEVPHDGRASGAPLTALDGTPSEDA